MENIVSIVNTRTNPLEFDISIQGVNDDDTTVKFVIQTDLVNFVFPCTKGEGDKWSVDIPPLPQIERIAYPFHIEIVVDGYYFEPYSGTLNVTAEPEVKATDVQKSRPTAPVVTPVVGNITVKEDDELTTKKDYMDELADKFLKKKKDEKKKVVVRSDEDKAKDKLVKAALAEFKKTPVKLPAQEEVIEEGGAEKAYDMGLDDGKKDRPKKDAAKSFGMFDKEYYKGYEEGKAIADHEAWQEKTAAKRQGADYHESAEPRKSNLAGAIKQLDEEPTLSDQAKKVRDIINK